MGLPEPNLFSFASPNEENSQHSRRRKEKICCEGFSVFRYTFSSGDATRVRLKSLHGYAIGITLYTGCAHDRLQGSTKALMQQLRCAISFLEVRLCCHKFRHI